jgi:hypothetical protein
MAGVGWVTVSERRSIMFMGFLVEKVFEKLYSEGVGTTCKIPQRQIIPKIDE